MSRDDAPKREGVVCLIDALKVLYYGLDDGDELLRLAENAFSGCAGTQRENQFELKEYLEKYYDPR